MSDSVTHRNSIPHVPTYDSMEGSASPERSSSYDSKATVKALIALPISIVLGALLAFGGSQGSNHIPGTNFPIYGFGVLLAFIINWVAFVPAYLAKTEKFYDLTGSFTYLSVSVTCVGLNQQRDHRAFFVLAFVAIWCVRLGGFLFYRIHNSGGKDSRFDAIRENFLGQLMVWTLQALWVSFTLAAALVTYSSQTQAALSWFALSGGILWSFGFFFEVIADLQKLLFKKNPENQGEFIKTGLWKISRHPNYFGEIVLWIGISLMCVPSMRTWQYVGLISPVFVACLLIFISGIPLLEKSADARWGQREDYCHYKQTTSVLVPFLNC